jgi:hypothetical protein
MAIPRLNSLMRNLLSRLLERVATLSLSVDRFWQWAFAVFKNPRFIRSAD